MKTLVVCGPTASGKTSFGIAVARRLPKANILSVDSRQVYQHLDIVTGKDIPEDLPKTINFYGLNIFSPDKQGNISDFVKYASKIIDESLKKKIPLIIVGGTGLYIKAITQGFSDIFIPQDSSQRQKNETKSIEELQKTLKEINEQKYFSLNNSDINNPRRLIRYIEIEDYKKRLCKSSEPHSIPNLDIIWVGFMPSKEEIRSSIKKRVEQRLDDGAVKEVETLTRLFPDNRLPIYSSLGVKQIVSYLNGNIDLSNLKKTWEQAEIDYARRQVVWFKKQTEIVWYDKDTDRNNLIEDIVQKIQTE